MGETEIVLAVVLFFDIAFCIYAIFIDPKIYTRYGAIHDMDEECLAKYLIENGFKFECEKDCPDKVKCCTEWLKGKGNL